MPFEHTRGFLNRLGLPSGDLQALPASPLRFVDDCHFRIEVPTVNSVAAAAALLDEASRRGVTVNRITETLGLFRHSGSEIMDFTSLAHDYGCELMMSVGPRATYDVGASVHSPQGAFVGYRLRGQEQLVYAIEDVKRGIELGVRSFVVYDEGLLWVLNAMRAEAEIPSDVRFKVSAHCGHANPASMKLLQNLGADSINPIRDLSLPILASLRAAVTLPLDCHTDNPATSGGFIRFYEAPELVRLLSPVYLKVGNSVLTSHGQRTTPEQGRLMAEQAAIVTEIIGRYFPDAMQSPARMQTGTSAPMMRVVQNV